MSDSGDEHRRMGQRRSLGGAAASRARPDYQPTRSRNKQRHAAPCVHGFRAKGDSIFLPRTGFVVPFYIPSQSRPATDTWLRPFDLL